MPFPVLVMVSIVENVAVTALLAVISTEQVDPLVLVQPVKDNAGERFEARLAARLPAPPADSQAGPGWQRTFAPRELFTVGQRVRVLARAGELPGVIGTVTGHVATLRLPAKPDPDWDDIWVDVGLGHDELVDRGVTPGTRVIWDAPCQRIGSQLVAKALEVSGQHDAVVAPPCHRRHRSHTADRRPCRQRVVGVASAAGDCFC